MNVFSVVSLILVLSSGTAYAQSPLPTPKPSATPTQAAIDPAPLPSPPALVIKLQIGCVLGGVLCPVDMDGVALVHVNDPVILYLPNHPADLPATLVFLVRGAVTDNLTVSTTEPYYVNSSKAGTYDIQVDPVQNPGYASNELTIKVLP